MVTFSITDEQYNKAKYLLSSEINHGKSVAIFCGHHFGVRTKLLAREITLQDNIQQAIELAQANNMGLLFVELANQDVLNKVNDLNNTEFPFDVVKIEPSPGLNIGHLTLHEDGKLSGYIINNARDRCRLERIILIGDNIIFWDYSDIDVPIPEFTTRHAQAFGRKTTQLLRTLKVAVIGCSGTGSPVIEQLARLGIGHLVLVDSDITEEKNLNRIFNSTLEDAQKKHLKVDVMARAVHDMRLATEVSAYPCDLYTPDAVRAVASCDVVFGCMDGHRGRFLLNKIATYYLLPYFDMGIRIDAKPEDGKIIQASGAVQYIQPHRSSLLSRRAISMDQVRAEGLKKVNPELYYSQYEDGYIKGVDEDRPGVISLNTQFAAIAVTEFLARLHSYRVEPNKKYACRRESLTNMFTEFEEESEPCPVFSKNAGRGDVEPLLDLPELSQ